MTRQELRQFDGRNGRKAYVAVNGKIYDVSDSPLWRGGDHQGEHQAGCDLSEELKSAPHVRAVMDRFKVVAELEEQSAPAAGAAGKFWLIAGLLVALIATLLALL